MTWTKALKVFAILKVFAPKQHFNLNVVDNAMLPLHVCNSAVLITLPEAGTHPFCAFRKMRNGARFHFPSLHFTCLISWSVF